MQLVFSYLRKDNQASTSTVVLDCLWDLKTFHRIFGSVLRLGSYSGFTRILCYTYFSCDVRSWNFSSIFTVSFFSFFGCNCQDNIIHFALEKNFVSVCTITLGLNITSFLWSRVEYWLTCSTLIKLHLNLISGINPHNFCLFALGAVLITVNTNKYLPCSNSTITCLFIFRYPGCI